MKKTVLILLTFFALTSVFAQQSLNDYKYIIVPNTFEFLNEADEYRLNSLTKFLFEKYNFEAIMEDDEVLPSDYGKNNCIGLKANVTKGSNMFKTKLSVQLKNCKNEVIYTSSVGESRDKNFKIAYNEALRLAFKSLEAENYSYNPKNIITNNEIVEVAEEHLEVTNTVEVEVKNVEEAQIVKEVKAEIAIEEAEEILIEEKAIVVNKQIEKETVKQPVSVLPLLTTTKTSSVLYAQKTINGYQLVDNTPKVVYKIKKTGMSNVFLVEGKNAILYQLDANWILEYYENEKLKTKLINIKF